jgi:hypothetical protein
MDKRPEQPPKPIELLGCVVAFFLMIAVIYCCVMANNEEKKQIIKESGTITSYAVGKVKNVETWKVDRPQLLATAEECGVNYTTTILDRVRITFEDGRVKELIGFPEEEIPKGKTVVITWSKYDFYLGMISEERYNSIKKENK